MSSNQKTRLFVAAKDLLKVLAKGDAQEEGFLQVLGALRLEVESTYQAVAGGSGNISPSPRV